MGGYIIGNDMASMGNSFYWASAMIVILSAMPSEKKSAHGNIQWMAMACFALILVLAGTGATLAAVWTDQQDYAPGSNVTISGNNSDNAGYIAGETVNVSVNGPNGYTSSCISTADSSGAWSCQVTLMADKSAEGNYTYTAEGQSSGATQSGTFTDAELVTAELTGTVNDVTVIQGGGSVPFIVSVSATGKISNSITSTNPSTARVNTSYTFTNGILSSSIFSSDLIFYSSGLNCTGGGGTNCDVTWIGAPINYSVPASSTADATTAAGNYIISLSSFAGTTQETNPSVSGGKLGDDTATNIVIHVRLAAPSGLTATGVSQSQINLTWIDNSVGEDNFAIERSTSYSGPFTAIATVGAGVTSYNDASLSCGTTEYYRVNATKTTPGGLNSDYSNIASATTSSCGVAPSITVQPSDITKTVGDLATFSVTAAGTSPLSYQWMKNGVNIAGATNNSYTISSVVTSDAGSYSVLVTNAYGSVTSSSATLTVKKAQAIVTLGDLTQTYTGSPLTPTVTTIPAGLSITWTGAPDTNAGSYQVTATVNDQNYEGSASDTFVINKADATIFITGYSVIYDGSAHTATGTATGVKGESLSGLDLSGTTHTNVGSYSDSWMFTDSTGNYNDTSGTISDSIAKADATISVTGYSITYDGNSHVASGSATGVKGESLSGLDLSGTTHTNAGSYTDTWKFTDITGNYNDKIDTVSDSISKKTASVTPNATSKTYGDIDPTFTGTLNGFLTGDGVTASYVRTTGETVAGNPYTISATLNPAAVLGNYDITYNTATFTINPATLTVTADNMTKILNAPNPTFTASYSGFKNGETLATSGVTGSPSLITTAITTSPVGSYPITAAIGALSATNYVFNFINGVLTVTYASSGTCNGDAGHQILQPINPDGSSEFKKGSTIPAKFRVCDANSVSIGTPGVVSDFRLIQTISGTTSSTVNEDVNSTTSDTAFRWDPTAQQWIFNINTKSLSTPKTYVYRIILNDGTTIDFRYGLPK